MNVSMTTDNFGYFGTLGDNGMVNIEQLSQNDT